MFMFNLPDFAERWVSYYHYDQCNHHKNSLICDRQQLKNLNSEFKSTLIIVNFKRNSSKFSLSCRYLVIIVKQEK